MEKKIVYLSLGSNMGDKEWYITEAISMIAALSGVYTHEVSSFYVTEPWGLKEQESFLNVAVRIETDLRPYDLLDALQKIELNLDRKRLVKWGPRTIDIDIILYGDSVIDDDRLTVPHRYAAERLFVLEPLSEFGYDIKIGKKSVGELIDFLKEQV